MNIFTQICVRFFVMVLLVLLAFCILALGGFVSSVAFRLASLALFGLSVCVFCWRLWLNVCLHAWSVLSLFVSGVGSVHCVGSDSVGSVFVCCSVFAFFAALCMVLWFCPLHQFCQSCWLWIRCCMFSVFFWLAGAVKSVRSVGFVVSVSFQNSRAHLNDYVRCFVVCGIWCNAFVLGVLLVLRFLSAL